ncbi:MAG: hypothetical protein C4332_01830 [Meiothermus sp.]
MAFGTARPRRVITALDTNVIVSLWSRKANEPARTVLEKSRAQGPLVICPPVYTELLASGRTRKWIDDFLNDVGIEIDWNVEEVSWVEAGLVFADYAVRRKRGGGDQPRRILVDFFIGAHALYQADRLVTADNWYSTIFPRLRLEPV